MISGRENPRRDGRGFCLPVDNRMLIVYNEFVTALPVTTPPNTLNVEGVFVLHIQQSRLHLSYFYPAFGNGKIIRVYFNPDKITPCFDTGNAGSA